MLWIQEKGNRDYRGHGKRAPKLYAKSWAENHINVRLDNNYQILDIKQECYLSAYVLNVTENRFRIGFVY